MFELVEKKIDFQFVITKVSSPQAGAISTFIGVTRNFTGDRRVKYLFYEAYHTMSICQMQKIGEQVRSKFDIEKIAITHRIGKVAIEEASVFIAVSASHREPAIEGCWYAIDTLKNIVPIWKKEFIKSGEQIWIANRG